MPQKFTLCLGTVSWIDQCSIVLFYFLIVCIQVLAFRTGHLKCQGDGKIKGCEDVSWMEVV